MDNFKMGDVVVFDPASFNPKFWNGLTEKQKLSYYGVLGYGDDRPHLYVFMTEIHHAPGHCVLISMKDQHVETMRHTSDFRLANENEV